MVSIEGSAVVQPLRCNMDRPVLLGLSEFRYCRCCCYLVFHSVSITAYYPLISVGDLLNEVPSKSDYI